MSLRRMVLGALTLTASLGAIAVPACSSDNNLPNLAYDGGGGNGGTAGVATGPCDTGATRKRGIELAKNGNTVNCYEGTQTCVGGTWGPCGDGTTTTKTVSDGPGLSPQAFSDASTCSMNPCDPYCNNYNEDAALSSEAGQPIYTWQGGQLSGFPGGLLNKGLKQPCQQGSDCQFNNYCYHPQTAGGCGHSKCQTGSGLTQSCASSDPCVAAVCGASAGCCAQTYPVCVIAGPDHDICTTGGKLFAGCDSVANGGQDCVTKVCGAAGNCGAHTCAYCCSNTWDADCVAAVATKCAPLNCSPNNINTPGNWDASCVAKVATTCDAQCSTATPPTEEAVCKPWIPGQTDPSCNGIDLSLGLPCANNIPVCNHGTVQAPAGIRLVHYPANSNQYPKCAPDQSNPQMYECYTTEAIQPGFCTTKLQYWDGTQWKPGCDQLIGNREMMINPQIDATTPSSPTPRNYAGHVTECHCDNNWTLYNAGTCGLPTCGSGTQAVQLKKLNLFVMIDRSMSMVSSGIWGPATSGLTSFYQQAAGIGVAQEFFPLPKGGANGDGCADATCTGGQCANPATPCTNPMVPLGTLTTVAGDPQETALINSFGPAYPTGGGGTPTFPALQGAEIWAMNNTTSNPTQTYSVVLITDGDPSNCDTNVTDIANLAANAFTTKGVKTYVIGVPGSTMTTLNQWAAAGGTGTAIQVTASNMAAEMLSAFNGIVAGQASCTFALPPTGLFDPNNIQLTLTSSSGTVTNLTKQASSAGCGSGWYFDNNTTPTNITLCPTSCSAANGDPGSKINMTVGCPTTAGPVTYDIDYQGVCPAGSKPIWQFLSYNSVCPGSSNITFKAATAVDQPSLDLATFHALTTAQSTPTDTQVCAMSGPSPCPIDLYADLGIPDAKFPWLRFEVTLTPVSGSVPTLNDWAITYSCPPSE